MSNVPSVQSGLGKTMFERVMELYGDDQTSAKPGRISRMLKVQYRMHETIANWASQALYGGELQTHEIVRSRTLDQLEGIVPSAEDPDETPPLLLLDTTGCHLYESTNAAGSRFNEGEAQLVAQHVRKLLAMGVPADQIAVITPYNGQVEILRLDLLPEAPQLQIRSVDGFQGGEREAVVLSLVRSSRRGGGDGIGFLRDDRRLNVAVTRAKRHCCVVCDSETVSQSPFIKNLLDWIDEHGVHRSAMDLEMMLGEDGTMDHKLELAEAELRRLVMASKKERMDPTEMSHRRSALLDKISDFQAKASPNDFLWMSPELTKLDRKLVHEIAEELGLEHQSEGVEGVNRRIKLLVPNPLSAQEQKVPSAVSPILPVLDQEPQLPFAAPSAIPFLDQQSTSVAEQPLAEPEDMAASEVDAEAMVAIARSEPPTVSAFAVLDDDDADSDQEISITVPELNSELRNLANERAERERRKQQSSERPKAAKSKKSQKLGGVKKDSPTVVEDKLDDLDDFAFLEAQIEKVQNSHGRQVEGTGKAYRTIVNGVLLAKPVSPPKKRDERATAALSAKLREAKEGRKAKVKK
jgi:AAA domain/R3H domain